MLMKNISKYLVNSDVYDNSEDNEYIKNNNSDIYNLIVKVDYFVQRTLILVFFVYNYFS